MRFPAIIALLLAVLLAAFFWFNRADSPSSVAPDAPDSSAVDRLVAPESLSADSATDEAPDATTNRVEAAPVDAAVSLQLVDELNGKALPVLRYRVLELGAGERELAKGSTDEEGFVDLTDIPRTRVVIETQRRPPIALAAHVVDLGDTEQRAHVVQLGRGGSIIGVVQDGEGVPLEGVLVYGRSGSPGLGSPPPVGVHEKPVATTDANGRFEAFALASRPRGLSLVDGEVQPQSWERVVLNIENPFIAGGPAGQAYEYLEQGQQLELGRPFVFKRARTLSGRVLDVNGLPAANHFVTTDLTERVRWRGFPPVLLAEEFDYSSAEFTLGANESITDAAGRFALKASPRTRYNVHIVNLTGLLEKFDVDDVCEEHGDCDVGDLQLRYDKPITLQLVGTDGEPLEADAFPCADDELELRWIYREIRRSSLVNLLLRDDEGSESRITCKVEAGGRVQFVSKFEPSLLRSLSVSSALFRSRRVPLPEGLDPAETLVLELEPMRILSVHIDAHGEFEGLDEFRLAVHPCAVPPDKRPEDYDAARVLAGGLSSHQCCGLSAARVWDWRGEDATARVGVKSDDAFYVYVFGAGRLAELPQLVAGPLRAGMNELTVDISAADLVAREAAPDQQAAPKTKAKDRRPSILVTLTDASTGEALPGAIAALHEPGTRMRPSSARLMPQEGGRLRAVWLDHGTYSLRIEATGYRSVELGRHELRPGEVTDVGSVSLEPIEPFRVRLLEADGAPLAEGTDVRVASRSGRVGADGVLVVHEDLPQTFLMNVQVGPWDQRVLGIDGWTPDEIQERHLAPLRRVEVILRGFDPAHETSLMGLKLRPLGIQIEHYGDPKLDWHSLPGSWNNVGGDALREPGTRSFIAQLGAGSYSAELKSTLYSMPDFTIEVTPGEGTQVIEVQVER